MHYIIKNSPETPNEHGERVEYSNVRTVVDELSGRPGITNYILGTMRNGKQRAYVATARGSEGRARYGQGFILEKIV